MICGDSARVYALEKDMPGLDASASALHNKAFRKGCVRSSGPCKPRNPRRAGAMYTSSNLLYPFIYLLQTESSLSSAIVWVFIDMENLLVRTGQSSSCARSVRDDPRRSSSRSSSQGKQRVLQAGPSYQDIPFCFTQRFHVVRSKEKCIRG